MRPQQVACREVDDAVEVRDEAGALGALSRAGPPEDEDDVPVGGRAGRGRDAGAGEVDLKSCGVPPPPPGFFISFFFVDEVTKEGGRKEEREEEREKRLDSPPFPSLRPHSPRERSGPRRRRRSPPRRRRSRRRPGAGGTLFCFDFLRRSRVEKVQAESGRKFPFLRCLIVFHSFVFLPSLSFTIPIRALEMLLIDPRNAPEGW